MRAWLMVVLSIIMRALLWNLILALWKNDNTWSYFSRYLINFLRNQLCCISALHLTYLLPFAIYFIKPLPEELLCFLTCLITGVSWPFIVSLDAFLGGQVLQFPNLIVMLLWKLWLMQLWLHLRCVNANRASLVPLGKVIDDWRIDIILHFFHFALLLRLLQLRNIILKLVLL